MSPSVFYSLLFPASTIRRKRQSRESVGEGRGDCVSLSATVITKQRICAFLWSDAKTTCLWLQRAAPERCAQTKGRPQSHGCRSREKRFSPTGEILPGQKASTRGI
ncbi:hypothetical protein KIL84_014403 [Mauremys mutica]|uniref:Uncharacterized protein n=1 Tax=Mauremys mutica TaxID=74926 RepID=A0A9D3XPL8_9SAUR|nr:hypothetical protein KIL84_014403 [Mauremys mutica]